MGKSWINRGSWIFFAIDLGNRMKFHLLWGILDYPWHGMRGNYSDGGAGRY